MKGVFVVLALAACATAYQYSYGYQPYAGYRSQQGNDAGFYQNLYNNYFNGGYKNYRYYLQEALKKQQQQQEQYEGTNEYSPKQQLYNGKTTEQYSSKKQQDTERLLKYINSPVYDDEFSAIYNNFDVEKYSQYYEPEAYKTFMYLYENEQFLKKGEIFSIFNDYHVKQVRALYGLFYTAKDYESFFKTAVWARYVMNEAMFVYTYSVAIIHRSDTKNVALPPIYEIYPHYFFNAEVIQKAYNYKMKSYNNDETANGVYTIKANYSGYYLNLNPEQSLSYYLEDVGNNAHYYYYNLFYPYWMSSDEYKIDSRRGEYFYYVHQQLVARYYLERLSHGVGGFEYFNWEVPFATGYYPSLTYPNGLPFNERPNFADLREYFYNYGQKWCFISKYGYAYTFVNNYEDRIREAIDSGYVYTPNGQKIDLYSEEGFNTLGNLIEGNADTVNYRYYGSYVKYARHLLGYSKQPLSDNKLAPSALEHYETSMRDPAFYQLYKKITLLFQRYLINYPPYNVKDLLYPGMEIQKVEIDPLVTYYDKFYADITAALPITPAEYRNNNFKVQVEQYRLNHKQFNLKLYINADKSTKSEVKVFLGPKYDEHGRRMSFDENRMNFIELDRFIYDFQAGQNEIVRNSRQFAWYASNFTNTADNYPTYDQRYMLPRGSEAGIAYQIYAIVYPYEPKYEGPTYLLNNKYPVAYPFDRPADFDSVYEVPNAYFKDVTIYHKTLQNDYDQQPRYFM